MNVGRCLKDQGEGVSGNWSEKAVAIGENHWRGAIVLSTATELFLGREDQAE